MTQTEQILRQHAAKYPNMAPTDAVKLLYQNEFGGGHMISDPQACLEYLRREYAQVTPDATTLLYEPIGNGILRVHLAALPASKLDALGAAFITSAEKIRGNKVRFLEKIDVLCKLAEAGVFAFDSDALAAYLDGYAVAGYPAVSHSDVYRAHYRPAYRVILEEFADQI